MSSRIENEYRVSRSVNPTRRASAEHTRVSSGPVPLYISATSLKLINFSIFIFAFLLVLIYSLHFASAANLIVYNNSAPSQTYYFVVNGTMEQKMEVNISSLYPG